MFFPDKVHAFAEARRVLRPGGCFIFSVWDRLEENDIPRLVVDALADVLPANPPQFLRRLPHAFFGVAAIEHDVRAAGFESPGIETIVARSLAASAWDAAFAFCEGTPLRSEIEACAGVTLEAATSLCAETLARHFGAGPVDEKIQAHLVCARR